MNKSIATRLAAVALAGILAACASSTEKQMDKAAEANSGFLGDYSKLKEVKDTDGKIIRGWASPKLTPANYNAIILDPLIFYPEPKPSERVTAGTLDQIIAYTNATLKQSLGSRFKLVDQPGPGVVRLRSAFSAVAAEGESLSAYQYVPLAFVATVTTRAMAGTPQRAFLVVESEIKDSVSNEVLAQRVRLASGEGIRRTVAEGGTEQITFETVKPLVDELAKRAYPELEKYVKPIK